MRRGMDRHRGSVAIQGEGEMSGLPFLPAVPAGSENTVW